jgi:hypothetical protein
MRRWGVHRRAVPDAATPAEALTRILGAIRALAEDAAMSVPMRAFALAVIAEGARQAQQRLAAGSPEGR